MGDLNWAEWVLISGGFAALTMGNAHLVGYRTVFSVYTFLAILGILLVIAKE